MTKVRITITTDQGEVLDLFNVTDDNTPLRCIENADQRTREITLSNMLADYITNKFESTY